MSEDESPSILRDILSQLVVLTGLVEKVTLRVMSQGAATQRMENQHDDQAANLAWSHRAAAEVPDDAPPGSKADAAVAETPDEHWEGHVSDERSERHKRDR